MTLIISFSISSQDDTFPTLCGSCTRINRILEHQERIFSASFIVVLSNSKMTAAQVLSSILGGESFILLVTEETPLKGRTRLNMRRHEVGAEDESRLVSSLVQWTSNSSGGSCRRKDGKSGNRLWSRWNAKTKIPDVILPFSLRFFFLFSLVRSALCDLSPLALSLSFYLFDPLRHRTLYTIDFCAPSVSKSFVVPLHEILRVKNLLSTRQWVTRRVKKRK